MTMLFRTVKQHLVQILGDNAAGRYVVKGYQTQTESSAASTDSDQIVRVFYHKGDFPKRGGHWQGPAKHEMNFAIQLIVSRAASGDLATLNNQNATAGELATAISNFEDAADVADSAWDELADIIYKLVTNNKFIQLDTSVAEDGSEDLDLATRWVDSIEKDQPVPRGEYVTVTGHLAYTVTCEEDFNGADALGTAETGGVDVDVLVNDDENEGRAGILAPE